MQSHTTRGKKQNSSIPYTNSAILCLHGQTTSQACVEYRKQHVVQQTTTRRSTPYDHIRLPIKHEIFNSHSRDRRRAIMNTSTGKREDITCLQFARTSGSHPRFQARLHPIETNTQQGAGNKRRRLCIVALYQPSLGAYNLSMRVMNVPVIGTTVDFREKPQGGGVFFRFFERG